MRNHGTVQGFWRGCRCLPCRAAQSVYNLERKNARRDGDWQGYVPADRVRSHLKKLKNMTAVALVAGLDKANLRRLRNGKQKKLYVSTEKLILSITREMLQEKRIPAEPTVKLVNELIEEGFSDRSLGRRLGIANGLRIKRKTVAAWKAERVQKFYDTIMLEVA